MSYWRQYVKYYLDQSTSSDQSNEDGLPYLRDKLFFSVLFITLPIVILAYIPSVIVSFMTHQFVIAIFDTLALLALLFIFFSKDPGIQVKKIVFSTTFYIVAIILLIYLGLMGPGIIILIFISVLITLFHSKKAGLNSIVLNAFIYSIVLVTLSLKTFNLTFLPGQITKGWIIVGINFIAFNTLIVLSVSFLVDQLNLSFLKEKNLQALLKSESLDLLKAKQKAEESDRLKSSFLANMSHEVRTPLNSIIGFSELLADPFFEEEQKSEFIHHIVTNGNHLLTIISDIMDISKIEAGDITIHKKQVNVAQSIAEVNEQFSFQAEEKKLELKLTLPDTKEETVIFADADRLNQIFNNLVSNALKFTVTGSIEIGYHLYDSTIEFFVRDTGIGIADEYHQKIFDHFRQVEDADTRTFGGNGLGLAISKNLVELMGGKIWVESQPDNGSVFYFTLPGK